MSNYKYKFSIIIPVYNIYDYLETAIKSITRQTIGFKNIQLILVNDGSTDRSEEICLKYQKKYPNNVIYVKQENKGVSSARNNGINYIEGKYVNFLDGDDKHSITTLKKVWDFFELHNEEVDVVSCRIKFFDSKKGWHINDYIFNDGNRVIDITKENDKCIYSVCSSFIRKEAIDNVRYNTSLKYGEDTLFLNLIVLKKCKFCVLKSAVYYYRKRKNETSATQTKKNNLNWYVNAIDGYYNYLYDYSVNKYGDLPYIQSLLLNGIYNRVFADVPSTIDYEIYKNYYNNIINLLKKIDDKIIFSYKKNKKIFLSREYYLFKLKYDDKFYKMLTIDNNYFMFKSHKMGKIDKVVSSSIKLSNKKDFYLIEGSINSLIPKELINPVLVVNNNKHDIDIQIKESKKTTIKDENVTYEYYFTKEIDKKNKIKSKDINILITFNNEEIKL